MMPTNHQMLNFTYKAKFFAFSKNEATYGFHRRNPTRKPTPNKQKHDHSKTFKHSAVSAVSFSNESPLHFPHRSIRGALLSRIVQEKPRDEFSSKRWYIDENKNRITWNRIGRRKTSITVTASPSIVQILTCSPDWISRLNTYTRWKLPSNEI